MNKAYSIDQKRFKESAFNIIKFKRKENIEAKIIFHYHSLEKGLSNINFRLGFGKNAYTQLIEALEAFIQNDYNRNSIAFLSGISVLNEYVLKHQETSVDVSYIKSKLEKLNGNRKIEELGGIFTLHKNQIITASKSNFETLAMNRYSVRDYSNKVIDDEKISKALQIASKTPSVCNRQPWNIYILKNKELINNVLEVQGGFIGHGNNIGALILIASNNHFLSDYTERNQGFTDCGMFSMSLIYALQ